MKHNKTIKSFLIIFFIIATTITIGLLYNKKSEVTKEKIEHKETLVDNVVFEGVGNYAFATAGNNNAYRGTSYSANDYSWIKSYPESDKVSYDWETIKTKILNDTGLTEITNMSGSYLNIDGKVQKALLSAVISKPGGTGYQGRVLIIKPDGTYNILDFNTNYWMTIIDITDVLVGAPKGWYYISYLDAAPIPQSGWTIAAVYENEAIEKNYIKMLNVNKTIQKGGEMSVMFDSKFSLQNDFQLVGVVMLAGSNGFQILGSSAGTQVTTDRAFAILDNNTEFQLYDRGDGHFTGRTDIDFANGIYGAQRSHNIQGGELDIFDEHLNSTYFNGRNIIGYRFIKDGSDLLNISVLGLSQKIVDANVSASTIITANPKYKEGSSVTIESEVRNNLKNGICNISYNNTITNTVDKSLSNISNLKVYLNDTTELNASYDENTRLITIPEISSLSCTDVVSIKFNATINSNIKTSVVNNNYNITSIVKNNYSLLDLSKLTGEELEKYSELKAEVKATDTAISPQFLTITVNHYKKDTTQKLVTSNTMGAYYGDTYSTYPESSLLINYNVTTPSNATGTATGDINVNYYYELKQATIVIRYLEEGTNKILSNPETHRLNYTDTFTYTAKDIANYQLVGNNKTISVTVSGNQEIIFYYTRKKATLTVNHYIEGTTTKLADTEISTVYWGNSYTTNKSASIISDPNSYYEYSSVTGTPFGTVSGNITVTYYYKKKQSNLIVKYLEDQTNNELAPEKTSIVYYGDTYTTSHSNAVPSNYELLRKTENYEGKAATATIEVIYYYQKKDSSLETSITKKGPEKLTKKDQVAEYNIIYNATTTDYIGNGNITIIDTLPYHIDTEKSDIAEGIYDSESNTITWTIPWNGIDSYNNKGSITITKSISLVYSDLLPTERIMINSVKGSVTLDNNSRTTESQTSTDINISGNITIHHYIKGTKVELIPSETVTDLVGEKFSTSQIKKDGYIVHKPETEVYTFTETPQEVIYEYEKIKVHITTVVDGKGGSITGDEEVEYGSDSTKDKIVITPDKGYILESVIINGIKIEITEEEREKLVLNNFTNLTEDMEIHVTFIKNSGVNAETGAFANFIVILLIIMIPLISYLKITKSKIIKL